MSSAPSDHLPTPSQPDEPGSLPVTVDEVKKIAGLRYQILRPHDKGGIGEVFVALDQELNRQVALKEIQERHAADEHTCGRFVREAEITGGLEHPGIVPVYGLGQYADGRPFYAMRFIQGETLKDAIARYHRSSEGGARSPEFELRTLLTRFVAVCNAIAYAHSRGVIHRDLKPSNIMLGKYGETLVVDWGMAKAGLQEPTRSVSEGLPEPYLVPSLADAIETQAGAAMGTPAYMSPEQASGRLDLLGPASDVYSLGATLYELLTGHPPIESKDTAEVLRKAQRGEWLPPRQVKPEVPPALDAVCRKAMATLPSARYATALGLAADIEHWLADEPVTAYRESWGARSRRWMRRHRTLVSTGVGVLVVALLSTTVGLVLVSDAERKEAAARRTADSEKEKAQQQKEEAVRRREEARFNEYVAQMNLVQREYEANNIGHVRELLEGLVPREADATDFRNFEWNYWHRMAHRELFTLKGHTDFVTSVAFTSDGRGLATTGFDKTASGFDQSVRVWDADTGKELLKLKGPGLSVRGVLISPDGRRLVTSDYDKINRVRITRVCDTDTGKELCTLKMHKGFDSVSFSPDGRRLATAGGFFDPSVCVWDTATGKELLNLQHQNRFLNSVSFSPDGRRLATAGSDQWVRVWDAATGKELLTLKGHPTASSVSFSVLFSPEGRRLATFGSGPMVRVWDIATGRELLTLKGNTSFVYVVKFSPDGRRLVSAGLDPTARVWDAVTGQELFTLKGHTSYVRHVSFSPDGRRLATASADQTVRVWNASTGQELLTLKGHTSRVQVASFSPDGKRLASFGPDQSDPMVRVWDATTGRELLTLKGHTSYVSDVSFSPDGRRLASAGGDQTVRVWDTATGQGLLTVKGMKYSRIGLCVSFSPDGRRLASASTDPAVPFRVSDAIPAPGTGGGIAGGMAGGFNTVRIWDAGTGKGLLNLKGHTGHVDAVSFNPDGRKLASTSWDGTVRVWNAATGKELLTLKGQTGRGKNSISFSPDGGRLATAGKDQSVRIWDTDTGKELLTLKGHTVLVSSVSFSPDGRRLASASWDQTIRVWDAFTGQELLTLKGHRGNVNTVSFSPDGQRLASAGWDQSVRVWDAAKGKELLTLNGHTSQINRVSFSPDGQRLASASNDGTVRVWEALPVTEEVWRRRWLVSHVHSLFEELLLREEVLAALRKDPTLDKADREFAIKVAESHLEDPLSWNEAAWNVVKVRDAGKDAYIRAQRLAEAAFRLAPKDGNILNTLGVAQYRAGRYADALAALTKSEKLNATKEGSLPADLAFLAMAQLQLGKKNEAKTTLDQLRKVMKQPRWTRDAESVGFLREAEELMEGKAAGKGQ